MKKSKQNLLQEALQLASDESDWFSLGQELNVNYDTLAQIKSKQDLTQIKSKQDLTQIKSMQDLTQIKGKQDLTQIKGKQDLTQIKGKQDLTQIKGKQDLTQIKGKQDLTQIKGRKDQNQPEEELVSTLKEWVNSDHASIASLEEALETLNGSNCVGS